MAEDDETVLNFGDSLLKKSDLNLLHEPNWINDKLIGFCFEYYERELFNHSADKLSLLSPSLTQILRFASVEDLVVLVEPLGLPQKHFIFIPINDNSDIENAGGTHWSLLVYNRIKQEFQHFDAMQGSNTSVAKTVSNKLMGFIQANKNKTTFVNMECPQQKNSYDCGMYVISMAEHLIKQLCECCSLSIKDAITQETVQRKRTQIHELVGELQREYEAHELGS